MSIAPIPEIKKCPHIFDAHAKDKLVVFLGAGLSAIWGCRRWRDMAISMIDDCYEEYGLIDYWGKVNLLRKYTSYPRKLITIAKTILGNDYYLESVKKTLRIVDEKKKKYPQLYEYLYSLNAAFITTNIDTHLSGLFPSKDVYFDVNAFLPDLLKPRRMFHLHGSIDREDSIVLTIDEYAKRYREKNVQKFLEHVFLENQYCLLFIGYSVDEMEIIDYMCEKYGEEVERKREELINRRYILLPFFQNEEKLLKHEESYFNRIGITVLPYAIDQKAYEQIYEVIGEWRNRLLAKDGKDKFYENIQLIERNL